MRLKLIIFTSLLSFVIIFFIFNSVNEVRQGEKIHETVTMFYRGVDLAKLGKYQEAIQWFDKVLATNENCTSIFDCYWYITDAMNNKGIALARLGRDQEAIQWYDKADEAFGSSSSSPSPSENGFLTYQDYSTGITMKYPSEWQKEGPKQVGNNIQEIRFIRPEGGAFLDVRAKPVPLLSNITWTQDKLGLFLANATKLAIEQNINTTVFDFRQLESNMTTLDGNVAFKLVYLSKGMLSEKEAKGTSLLTLKDDMIYQIHFTGTINIYNHYEPTFQRMVESFKLN